MVINVFQYFSNSHDTVHMQVRRTLVGSLPRPTRSWRTSRSPAWRGRSLPLSAMHSPWVLRMLGISRELPLSNFGFDNNAAGVFYINVYLGPRVKCRRIVKLADRSSLLSLAQSALVRGIPLSNTNSGNTRHIIGIRRLNHTHGLHVHSCTHWLRPRPRNSPPPPPEFGLIYESAIGQPRS